MPADTNSSFLRQAIIKIAEEVNVTGAQEFARLNDHEAHAWERFVAQMRDPKGELLLHSLIPDKEDPYTVTLHEGDDSWHDGPGWYYVIDELPDEGSCGAFESRDAAAFHATECGYKVGA